MDVRATYHHTVTYGKRRCQGGARYRDALDACIGDSGVDAILALLVPQAMTDPIRIADEVINAAKGTKKPVLACWMGDAQVREARQRFSAAGIPHFDTPEASVEAFASLERYQTNHERRSISASWRTDDS